MGRGSESVRERMDSLAKEIAVHIVRDPDDFDGREDLWMQREDLRAQLDVREARSA